MTKAVRESKGGYAIKQTVMTRRCECGGVGVLYSLRSSLFRCTRSKCQKKFKGEI